MKKEFFNKTKYKKREREVIFTLIFIFHKHIFQEVEFFFCFVLFFLYNFWKKKIHKEEQRINFFSFSFFQLIVFASKRMRRVREREREAGAGGWWWVRKKNKKKYSARILTAPYIYIYLLNKKLKRTINFVSIYTIASSGVFDICV